MDVAILEEVNCEALETIAAEAAAAEAVAAGLFARSETCKLVSLSTSATVAGSPAKNAVEARRDTRIGCMRLPAALVFPVEVKKSICDCTVAARAAAELEEVLTFGEERLTTLEETAAEAAAAEAAAAGLICATCP